MGRKGGNKKGGGFGPIHHRSATLRQQRSGIKINASENVPSVLRLEHLKNLANWAGGEASIPPLAALFGHRLSSVAEEIGVPLDASLFPCQRCEIVLRPGHNCIVRIEKNKTKKQKHRQREQLQPPTQNNVVYHCNFCLHKNVKGGTRKSYMKELYSWCSKQASNVDLSGKSCGDSMQGVKQVPEMELLLTKDPTPKKCSEKVGEETPILLSTKKRQHNAICNRGSGNYAGSSKKSAGVLSSTSETGKGRVSSSSKRRKEWTTLKEIAERESQDNTKSTSRLPIPFLLSKYASSFVCK